MGSYEKSWRNKGRRCRDTEKSFWLAQTLPALDPPLHALLGSECASCDDSKRGQPTERDTPSISKAEVPGGIKEGKGKGHTAQVLSLLPSRARSSLFYHDVLIHRPEMAASNYQQINLSSARLAQALSHSYGRASTPFQAAEKEQN